MAEIKSKYVSNHNRYKWIKSITKRHRIADWVKKIKISYIYTRNDFKAKQQRKVTSEGLEKRDIRKDVNLT